MNTRILLAWGLLVTGAAFAAEIAPKHPITHEALWLLKRVGAPTASPDGK